MPAGHLDLEVDPKTSWALLNRERFPVDVNKASREQLLRVPGLGVKVIDRILASRRHATLRYADLARMGASLRKAKHFIQAADYHPKNEGSSARLRGLLAAKAPAGLGAQQSLF